MKKYHRSLHHWRLIFLATLLILFDNKRTKVLAKALNNALHENSKNANKKNFPQNILNKLASYSPRRRPSSPSHYYQQQQQLKRESIPLYNSNPQLPTIPFTSGLKPYKQTNVKARQPSQQNRYSRSRKTRNTINVTTKLFLANVAIFISQTINPNLTKMGAKVSNLILSGQQPHRLITAMFLHGGVGHLAVNSYSLLNIGPQVESTFGRSRLFSTYLLSGIAGNLMSSYLSPNPSVGASGAIFGLISAYYIFLQRNSLFFGKGAQRGMSSIQQTLGINLVLGMMNPMIDNWGHLGGALGGALCAYVFGPRLRLMNVSPFEGGPTILVDDPIIRFEGPDFKFIKQIPKNLQNTFGRWKRKLLK